MSLTGTNITASFKYHVSGCRVSKTINGKTQNYLYDGADIIQESGNKSASYTYGAGVDEPLLRKTSTQREYYLVDALGSIIGLTDDAATVKTAYSYSPYSKKATTGFASDNPYGFTAREGDETGLYFYQARYYSPDQKRFIAEDPLKFGSGDSNFYAYVGGNPVNNTDPSGMFINQAAIEAARAASIQVMANALRAAGRILGGLGIVLSAACPEPLANSNLEPGDEAEPQAEAGGDGARDGSGCGCGKEMLGRGSTANLGKDRTLPRNIREQLAIKVILSNPMNGIVLPVQISDPRWLASDGWVKMQQIVKTWNGPINVQYVRNTYAGDVDDCKIMLSGPRTQ